MSVRGACLQHRGWRVHVSDRAYVKRHNGYDSCDRVAWRHVHNDKRYYAAGRAAALRMTTICDLPLRLVTGATPENVLSP
jgi:hypothetical protein